MGCVLRILGGIALTVVVIVLIRFVLLTALITLFGAPAPAIAIGLSLIVGGLALYIYFRKRR